MPQEVVTLQADRTFLLENHEPPRHISIWMGLHTGRRFQGFLRRSAIFNVEHPNHPDPESLPKNAQVFFMSVGSLLFAGIWTAIPHLLNLNFKPSPFLRQIWPSKELMGWPPFMPLNDEAAHNLINSFGRMIEETLAAIKAHQGANA